MDQLLSLFLSSCGIHGIDKKDLHFQLLTHPDQPSIKSITDTLDYFGIENIAAQVPKEALDQLPRTFLAVMEESDNTAMVLATQQNKKLNITNLSEQKETLSVAAFLEKWTGTVIAIEKDETTTIPIKANVKGQMGVAFLMILFLLVTIYTNEFQWYSLLYKGLGWLGVIVSYLIVKEQLGIKDAVTAKVCGALSAHPQGCSAVVNSKQSEIFKDFDLGDLSLLYFTSISLGIMMFGLDFSLLYVLSLLTLPVVAYTLIIQRTKLKSWCMLCLVLSTILLSQFTVLQMAPVGWDFSFDYILKAILLGSSLSVAWIAIKQLIKDRQSLEETRQEFYKFKRNPDFFFHALKNNPLSKFNYPNEVVFGNEYASLQLIAITNPLCGYCAESFKTYYKLLSKSTEDIGIRFVFSTPNDESNISTRIILSVLEIYELDRSQALEALNYWFANKNVDKWFAKYGEHNSDITEAMQVLHKHRNWCNSNGINYTPETIIAGYKYPRQHYQYSDLPLFIEDLKELTSHNESEALTLQNVKSA